ncbi:hypothetical protein CWI38_0985p0030 [Hamiltosporidium tvaerminnensis]|uniref:Uncharacterized protein n=1 Tax=Hamiltosporidium tvaerminnensis TaxID=1176355 RepID=A0A4Q9LWA4_9MICR|nr:hypothetical protein CWI38_0985p0030 [Hamiltosporidium tvaerminnensis]
MFQHCNQSIKTEDQVATKCEKMLDHDLSRRHNEVVRCIHLLLLNKYKFKVDTRIKTYPIYLLDKKQNKITLIEVGITSQDSHKIYGLVANELGLIYKCNVDIIPYTNVKRLQIPINVEAYIQSIQFILIDKEDLILERTSLSLILGVEEDGVKTENTRNILPLILDGITPEEEPTTNTNKIRTWKKR